METQRITYVPQGGVCSKLMIIDAKEGVIEQVQIVGGCHGNTQGLSKLLVGMKVEEAIRRLEGIDCRERGTSCPDQMAQALKQFK
ncbi:MAG: TIGR03905 family TSCPD domain-containing protein [Parabacteroides sp.]|nr:TIGR03905 family TSCPD domain-containing protein [Parabacteroides sp.]